MTASKPSGWLIEESAKRAKILISPSGLQGHHMTRSGDHLSPLSLCAMQYLCSTILQLDVKQDFFLKKKNKVE